MKTPSGDLIVYAALLLGGAAYLSATGLRDINAEFQVVTAALVACLVVEGVLLLFRFRWSPEIFVAIILFVFGFSVVRSATKGWSRKQIVTAASGVCALFAYPTLRNAVRGRSTASDEPEAETEDGE